MSEAVAPASRPKRGPIWLLAPLLALAFFSLLAGLLAKAYSDSSPSGYFDLIFSDTIHMKAWLASTAAALALFQLFTAAWIFRRLPWALWHSLLGSAFFGAFGAKVTIVRLKRFPVLVLPLAGGLLFAVLIGVWYTSAVWFFRLVGVGI